MTLFISFLKKTLASCKSYRNWSRRLCCSFLIFAWPPETVHQVSHTTSLSFMPFKHFPLKSPQTLVHAATPVTLKLIFRWVTWFRLSVSFPHQSWLNPPLSPPTPAFQPSSCCVWVLSSSWSFISVCLSTADPQPARTERWRRNSSLGRASRLHSLAVRPVCPLLPDFWLM